MINDNNIIVYIASGLLGDFFSQLSVIKEKYNETGQKGILYICNIKETFRNPLEEVYKDTYDIIMSQEYIIDYKIFNNEAYDIDLSSWRHYPLLFQQNFHKTYSSTYNIDWNE